ncbi:hypothetical protein Tco_1204228 [Tanacetum coccineum]
MEKLSPSSPPGSPTSPIREPEFELVIGDEESEELEEDVEEEFEEDEDNLEYFDTFPTIERLESRKKPSNPEKICNFVGRVRGLKVFVGNFTYECDLVMLGDTTSVIDHYLGGMVLGKSFVKESRLVYDKDEGAVVHDQESKKELVKPFDEPKQAFHSLRKLFKTPNFDHSNPLGPKKTTTQGFARPKFDKDAKFELKGQFLKELRDNTFSGSENKDANEHIERVLKTVDLFTTPDEVILFYKGLDVPTRQILDSKGVVPKMSTVDAKKVVQEIVDHSKNWHDRASTRNRSSNTSDGLAAIQAQLNNLGREIKKVNEKVYAAQVGCELCNGPHYTKGYPLKEEGKTLEETYYTQLRISRVLKERGSGSLSSSTKTNAKDHVKSISTSEEAETPSICRIGFNRYVISSLQKNDNMPLIELSQVTIPFPGRLKEYGDDVKEVSKELEKLQVNSTESGTCLGKLLEEK